ncbi:hypothetical protein L2E82_50701 [Cichorium intybus]|nr:hypothetical protein L2E82_50701 [Cichorium intybus]
MVTTDVELQLTQQLKEAGKRLLRPPTSDDDLLHVLDQTEKLLSMVDQSPNELMKEALNPLIKGFVDKTLLEHSNVDVKVAVASCLSEITRITAPEAPYNDEELKDVFQLIVSTFEDLSDKSSWSYVRRASILETVSKVRSCVIMLDLECEDLIVEMFEHFFKSIRDHHNDIIFSSMVDIMYLIFEESEDISVNMLKPLLSSIKYDSEGVLPVARKLGEKVIQKSGAILRPYLKQTLIILGDSLDNYTPVLASICEDKTNFEHNDESALVQQKTDESKLAKECLEDAPQGTPKKSVADDSKVTKPSDNATQVVKENTERPVEAVATPNRTLKIVMSNGGKVIRSKEYSPAKDSSKKPEEAIDHRDSNLIGNKEDSPNKDSSKKPEEAIDHQDSNLTGNKEDSPNKDSSKKPEEAIDHQDSNLTGNKEDSPNKDSSKKPEEAIDHQDSNLTGNKENSPDKDSSKKSEEAIDRQDSSLTSKVDVKDSVDELAKVESKPESNKEGNENDDATESVKPSDSSHGKNKNEKENDIQVSIPEVQSKPEETSNKEVDKIDDVTMTSAEPSDSSHGENKDDKIDANKDDKNDENKDKKNDDIQVSVPEVETEVVNIPSQSGNLPEESNVEKVDLSNKEVSPQKEEAEVANAGTQSQSGGLPYKIHIRKGPRSKKKSLIKDDTPLIDVFKKKATIVQEDKLPAVTAMSADDKATSGSDTKVSKRSSKKVDTVGSGSKPEKKSAKKVGGGGGLKKKRKFSGKKSGGGGSGAKKAKQGGKKVDEESKLPSTPSKKDDDSDDSYDKPLKQSAGKEDGSDSDSKLIKLSAKKGNKVVKSSAKNTDGKNVEEKDQAKSLPEDDGMDISPKTAVKIATEEGNLDETPATSSKRKRPVGKNNVKKTVKYDDSLIGLKVKVWWPDDKKYYEGVIESFDSAKNKHKVSYVDGDEERLNLKKEKWEILQDFSVRNEEKPAEVESSDDETLSKMITYKSKSKINDSTKSTEDGDAEETPGKSTDNTKSGSKGRRKRKKRM